MKLRILSVLGLLQLLVSCEKLIIQPAENSPREIYHSLWESYDLHYACFEVKKINWDSIYSVYDTRITNTLSDDQLFNILSEMLDNLKDPHVWLATDKKFYSYKKPAYIAYYNYNNINKYLTSVKTHEMFTYGKLEGNIGYFHISTFKSELAGYSFIDNIIEEFKSCNGIVIDVRANGGGSDYNAELIASRFYDVNRAYGYFIMRNGPNHNDFSDKNYTYLNPAANARPDIPIILLTDKSVGSAGEDFTLMLRILPQVTVVGDFTGANPGGSPHLRELQNGWIYYTPTALQYTMDDELFLDVGMKPDIYVPQQQPGKDLMIEKAIEILK